MLHEIFKDPRVLARYAWFIVQEAAWRVLLAAALARRLSYLYRTFLCPIDSFCRCAVFCTLPYSERETEKLNRKKVSLRRFCERGFWLHLAWQLEAVATKVRIPDESCTLEYEQQSKTIQNIVTWSGNILLDVQEPFIRYQPKQCSSIANYRRGMK